MKAWATDMAEAIRRLLAALVQEGENAPMGSKPADWLPALQKYVAGRSFRKIYNSAPMREQTYNTAARLGLITMVTQAGGRGRPAVWIKLTEKGRRWLKQDRNAMLADVERMLETPAGTVQRVGGAS